MHTSSDTPHHRARNPFPNPARGQLPLLLAAGWLVSLLLAGTTGRATEKILPSPELTIERVTPVDADREELLPTCGEPFWLEVEFTYRRPIPRPFRIRFEVNGIAQTTVPFDFSRRIEPGTDTVRFHWGPWLLHQGGLYPFAVELDSGSSLVESDETDNLIEDRLLVRGERSPQWELVNAALGRELLGDGTDVIVGSMDDAVDFKHPWLGGGDSRGRSRLVAALQNHRGLDNSPVNAEHATAVLGIILARGERRGDLRGLAPDARYVVAEFLNRSGVPDLEVADVRDAAGFLVEHGAEVINLSWSYWRGEDDASYRGEAELTNLLVDYLAYGKNIVCVPAVNQFADHAWPTAPGSSRNTITVGGLGRDHERVWELQNHGPTPDGRSKPDLLGGTAESTIGLDTRWREGRYVTGDLRGTSYCAPLVTGGVAQMLDFARRTGQNRDHRVIKAVLLAASVPRLRSDGSPWSAPGPLTLDVEQGAGLLDLERVHATYSAGEQRPGRSSVPGYDLGTVTGNIDDPGADSDPRRGRSIHDLGELVDGAASLVATLTWDRHTFWNDRNANGRIDREDTFHLDPEDRLDNLDLVLLRDGVEIAASRSPVDNTEHLRVSSLLPGRYQLVVERTLRLSSGDGETFGLAWIADGVWVHDPPVFRRGDTNSDGILDVSDPLVTLGALFAGVGRITCLDAADFNDDGRVDITDGVSSLAYQFQGLGALPAPGASTCGPDPTPDAISCQEDRACDAARRD